MAAKKKPAAKYHHGDLRPALIATAWSMVTKRGVEALSLRSVAEALGVSHAAPAHHFPDKEALLDALRAEAWRRFAEVLEAAEPEGLRALGRAYIAFAAEHSRQMQLMFRAGTAPTQEIGAEAGRAWGVVLRVVAKEIGPRRAADSKELHAMAMAAWAGVHGFATLLTEVALPDGIQRGEALRERVLDAILTGLH